MIDLTKGPDPVLTREEIRTLRMFASFRITDIRTAMEKDREAGYNSTDFWADKLKQAEEISLKLHAIYTDLYAPPF